MDTGQLFMQLSSKAKVDFSMPTNTSITSKPVKKNESGSFDGFLSKAVPKQYRKYVQSALIEASRSSVKDLERKEELIKQQPREVSRKSSDQKKLSESYAGQAVENKPESKLSEKPDAKSISQNVDTSAVVAAATLAEPLLEGRMPQFVFAEDNSDKIDGLGKAQNAILELQLPEGKIFKTKPANVETSKSGEEADIQNADVAIMTPSDELTAEVFFGKNPGNELQADLAVRNALAGGVVFQQLEKTQPILKTELAVTESGKIENNGEQLPLSSVITTSQNKAVDVQLNSARPDSNLKTVSEVGQQPSKTGNLTQKNVLAQETVKSIPVEVSVEAAAKNVDQLLQAPIRSQSLVSASEFRFSSSASVEASLGMAGSMVEQPKEKLSVSFSESGKVAVNVVSESMPAEFSGSGSGFTENDTEGFGQQNLELPKPGLQQMTNGQVAGFTNLSSGNVEQTEALQQPKMASSENVAGQVKAQLSTRDIKQGSEQITIQLSPDHLGDIKVNFRLEDQKLRVEIVAENRSARESLLQHADSLKESLARQNINMEKFEVTGGNNGNANQGGNSQPEWREMARNRQSHQWLAAGGYRTESTEPKTTLPVYFARTEKSTLDLHF